MIGIDKYKFAIAVDGSLFRYITPSKPIIVSGSRSGNSYRFSKKSSVWKIVRYQNSSVYDDFIEKLDNLNTTTSQIKCRVELYDQFSTLTEYTYEGYAYLNNISVNEDSGTIEFTPEEDSDYAWYDEHKNDKVELVGNIAGATLLKYYVETELEEYYIPNGVGYTTPTGFYSTTGSIGDWNYSTQYYAGWVHLSWCRYGGRLYHAEGDNINSMPAPENDDWERLQGDNGNFINLTSHVYRQVADLPFTDSLNNEYIHGNDLYEDSFPAVLTADSDSTKNNLGSNRFYSNPTSTTTTSGYMTVTGSSDTGYYNYQTYEPGLSAVPSVHTNAILTYLLKGSDLYAKSHYLEDATNPVSGTTNMLKNLRSIPVVCVKGIQDYSTSIQVTLEETLNDLCNTFNMYWYISSGVLVLEHSIYFENGFSYTPNSSVYADLTNTTTYKLGWQTIFDLDGSKSDNSYKFDTSAPAKEVFHFNDGYDYDGEIWYDSGFAKKGVEQKYTISTYITDFAYLLYNRIDTTDEGLCLIACDDSNVMLRRSTGLRWLKQSTTDVARGFTITESRYPNGDLQWHNLLNDWWKYYTYFLVGRINNQVTPTTFLSQRRIKKQRDIRFPRLESGSFKPYYLITTNIGDGQVSEYEINTDTDFIKVTLIY